ncbi:MAG: hypothetical protein PF693_17680 [Spirochaetia bacterium]|jgi:hypothetical protein|nr:hypothetical protein [Spirochaetia bacterium]
METNNSDEKIGEWLIRAEAMSLNDVETVLKEQREGNESLFGIIAMELGLIDPDILLTFAEMKGL